MSGSEESFRGGGGVLVHSPSSQVWTLRPKYPIIPGRYESQTPEAFMVYACGFEQENWKQGERDTGSFWDMLAQEQAFD